MGDCSTKKLLIIQETMQYFWDDHSNEVARGNTHVCNGDECEECEHLVLHQNKIHEDRYIINSFIIYIIATIVLLNTTRVLTQAVTMINKPGLPSTFFNV